MGDFRPGIARTGLSLSIYIYIYICFFGPKANVFKNSALKDLLASGYVKWDLRAKFQKKKKNVSTTSG